jgi:hypothetical protein
LGIVAVAVLAAACGSTLPLATQRQLEDGGGEALAGGLGASHQAGGQTATNAGSVPSGSAGSAVSGASPGPAARSPAADPSARRAQ